MLILLFSGHDKNYFREIVNLSCLYPRFLPIRYQKSLNKVYWAFFLCWTISALCRTNFTPFERAYFIFLRCKCIFYVRLDWNVQRCHQFAGKCVCNYRINDTVETSHLFSKGLFIPHPNCVMLPIYIDYISAASHCCIIAFQVKMNLTRMRHRHAVSSYECSVQQCNTILVWMDLTWDEV